MGKLTANDYYGDFKMPNEYVPQIPELCIGQATYKLLQMSYHRNGSDGAGYRNAIIDHTKDGETTRFLVVSFSALDDEDYAVGYGYTAAFDLDMLGRAEGIASGVNSWRSSAMFENAMRVFHADLSYLWSLDRFGDCLAEEWHPESRLAKGQNNER